MDYELFKRGGGRHTRDFSHLEVLRVVLEGLGLMRVLIGVVFGGHCNIGDE